MFIERLELGQLDNNLRGVQGTPKSNMWEGERGVGDFRLPSRPRRMMGVPSAVYHLR